MVNQALLGVLAGGVLTIVGTWVGARWQAAEARKVRQEQYAREDSLRDQNLRRDFYVKFISCANEAADASIGISFKDYGRNSALAEIVVKLDRMALEIELFGSPRVVAAAHYVVDAADNSPEDSDELNAAIEIFLREARRELGFSTQNLPMASLEWVRKKNRIDWKEVIDSLGIPGDD